jgi:hypothetical protein
MILKSPASPRSNRVGRDSPLNGHLIPGFGKRNVSLSRSEVVPLAAGTVSGCAVNLSPPRSVFFLRMICCNLVKAVLPDFYNNIKLALLDCGQRRRATFVL